MFADFPDTEELWDRVLESGVIDPAEPVCLLVTSILHFMPDSTNPRATLAFYRDRVPSGSMLVLIHVTGEADQPSMRDVVKNTSSRTRRQEHVVKNYARTTNPACQRDSEEFKGFFEGWEPASPGVVWMVERRPDGGEPEWWEGNPARSGYLAGVGVKP